MKRTAIYYWSALSIALIAALSVRNDHDCWAIDDVGSASSGS
jgi:hypothetical protein